MCQFLSFVTTNSIQMAALLRAVIKMDRKKLAVAAVFGIGGAYVIDQGLKYRATSTKSILQMLEKGSRPCIPLNRVVPREDIWSNIENTFLKGDGRINEGFGIIFGPSGSGKTMAIRKACNDNPKGVLYVELKGMKKDYTLLDQITDQLKLKVKPVGIIDLALGHISSNYSTYHQLPADIHASLDYIFNLLTKASIQYKEQHQQMPVLFIDGCDTLAKSSPKIFDRLVHLAKVLINDKTLRIVFVSSDGKIIPLIQKSSALNRCAPMQEIGDIKEEQAVKFVCNHQIHTNVAKRVVDLLGGRLVYLNKAINNYMNIIDVAPANLVKEITEGTVTEVALANLVKEITEEIIAIKTEPQREELLLHKHVAHKLLQQLSTKGYVTMADLKDKNSDVTQVKDAIRAFMSVNLLRYNKYLYLTWHSRIEEKIFKIEQ